MKHVTTGSVLRYTMLPGIIPRFSALFLSGFAHIALFMAHIYASVRLLPAHHPYLNPANAGRFGIRHVIFEARRHLEFKKENADQVIIFFTLLAGIVILFMQFALLIGTFLIPSAGAAPNDYTFFFETDAPLYDLAFRMLDLTFGFEDPVPIFNSCAIQGAQCHLAFAMGPGFTPVGPVYDLPNQYHIALHTLFHFYNIGVLAVGFMIMMYMFVTIVGETAQSGTPFGKRFNGMWAPVRLIFAIALLTPLSFGMNFAQLMTLVIAKWGSGLATNGWIEFMGNLGGTPVLGEPATLVARPDAPQIDNLVEFTFVALTCRYAEELMNRRVVEPYIVFPEDFPGPINAPFLGTPFITALEYANNGDITLRFGIEDAEDYERMTGHVKPVCGELVFHTRDVTQPGAMVMQEGYYELVQDLWEDGPNNFFAENIALRMMPVVVRDPAAPLPDNAYIADTLGWFNDYIPALIDEAREAQIAAAWNQDYLPLGWAGAGIWYQKIAEYTGSMFSAVYGVPTAEHYPSIMEHVKNQRRIHNDFVTGLDRYDPVLSNGEMIEFENNRDRNMAVAYFYAQQFWWSNMVAPEGNVFIDTVLSIFGLDGLVNIHQNRDIHPLALLVGIGRSLIESAVTNLGFSFGAGVGGGIANIMGANLVGSVALAASSFAGQIAMIGLSIGFILFYILPFLPFIYFFFAVGGWVKSIFEAMVGLPLWALAHVRIDGEGLPGPVAMNGYYLIFEILIRPILIIFGLLAGIIIFSSQVQILNDIWPVVTSSVMGFDIDDMGKTVTPGTDAMPGAQVGTIEYLRGAADYLFNTIIYVILVYMMAMASFKLVDLIPNNILRWIGASVSTFAEQAGDPAASLVQYAFMGSNMATGPINQGISGIAQRAAPHL